MFCSNNSPHQTNYSSIFKVKRFNSTFSQPIHEILTYPIWSEIQSSLFYQQDYQLFKLLSTSSSTLPYVSSSLLLNDNEKKNVYISPKLKSYHKYPFV